MQRFCKDVLRMLRFQISLPLTDLQSSLAVARQAIEPRKTEGRQRNRRFNPRDALCPRELTLQSPWQS